MKKMQSSYKRPILGIGAAFVDHIIAIEDRELEVLGYVKGSVNVLDIAAFDRLLQSHISQRIAIAPGGSCANMIRGLKELGWQCALTGKVGDDKAGHWLLSDLQQRAIDTHYTYAIQGTAQAICFITPDGERTMCDYLGASTAMQTDDLLADSFASTQLVHIEGYSLLQEGLTEHAMQLARAASTKVSFDLANFSIVNTYRDRLEFLIRRYVTLLFSNAAEAQALTDLTTAASCQKLSTWCSYAIVTDGSSGSYVGHNGTVIHCTSNSVEKIIDTTGAGDLYSCGFLDGWLKNLPLECCAAQGALLAAAVIQQASASLPLHTWQALKKQL